MDTPRPNTKPLRVSEVAALTGFNERTIRRRFIKEPGVILLDRPSANRKRRYRSLRIPRAVYERVLGKMTV